MTTEKQTPEADEDVSREDVEVIDEVEISSEVEVQEDGEGSEDESFDQEADEADDSEDDEYELVELELSDEDIVCYLEDEEGNRVGFVVMEDDEEVEYFYVEEEVETKSNKKGDEIDFGITKEGVAQATSDMNDIYRDGAAVAGELKAAFDDIKSAFDFSAFKN